MKIAVCYYSQHHGNTRKVLETMAQEGEVDLIDVTTRQTVSLEKYDLVGFASGIYYGKFQRGVLQFARQYLPQGKKIFFVYTYGIYRPGYTKEIGQIVREKGGQVLGKFGCKGYDTFGPFKLVGGIAKGHPDERDLEKARGFFCDLRENYGGGEKK